MSEINDVYYLEIVSTEVDAVVEVHERLHGWRFSPPQPLLGNARVASLADGSRVAVRAPMHAQELPLVRPYRQVANLEAAVEACVANGAVAALPAMEIPGQGRIAICQLGGVELAFWQVP